MKERSIWTLTIETIGRRKLRSLLNVRGNNGTYTRSRTSIGPCLERQGWILNLEARGIRKQD